MAEENKKANKKRQPTALKRDIQNKKRNLINRSHKTKIKTATRDFETALSDSTDKKLLQEKLSNIFSLYDKGVKNNVLKQNKAARKKSTLSAKLLVAKA